MLERRPFRHFNSAAQNGRSTRFQLVSYCQIDAFGYVHQCLGKKDKIRKYTDGHGLIIFNTARTSLPVIRLGKQKGRLPRMVDLIPKQTFSADHYSKIKIVVVLVLVLAAVVVVTVVVAIIVIIL